MTSTGTPLSPEERARVREGALCWGCRKYGCHNMSTETCACDCHFAIRLLDQVEALEAKAELLRQMNVDDAGKLRNLTSRADAAEERVRVLAEAVVYAFSKSEPDEGSRYRVALDAARQALAGGGPDDYRRLPEDVPPSSEPTKESMFWTRGVPDDR